MVSVYPLYLKLEPKVRKVKMLSSYQIRHFSPNYRKVYPILVLFPPRIV